MKYGLSVFWFYIPHSIKAVRYEASAVQPKPHTHTHLHMHKILSLFVFWFHLPYSIKAVRYEALATQLSPAAAELCYPWGEHTAVPG